MKNFDQWLTQHQMKWRKANVESKEQGRWRGRQYPWILPEGSWEEGLWPGIRQGSDNPLPAYLESTGVQKHEGVHNLKSSWILCANLYFPFGGSADGKALFASFLKRRVAEEIDSLEAIELEYEDRDSRLRPLHLLGEIGGTRGANQTSPDLGLLVNRGRGLVLVENKLTEKSFYECSTWRHKGSSRRLGNPDPNRCNHAADIVKNHADQCHQAAWGRSYWEHLVPVVDEEALASLPHCPAMKDGFQLFRQQALAEGIAQTGRYDLVVSVVAVDERNDEAEAALRRSGIAGLRQWGQLFKGWARFAVFTHQEWIGWVQEHDTAGRWSDWLGYVRSRYDMGGQLADGGNHRQR